MIIREFIYGGKTMDKINKKIMIAWAVILIFVILGVTYIIVHLSKDVLITTLNYKSDLNGYVIKNREQLESIQASYDDELEKIQKETGITENLDAIYLTNYISNYQLERTLELEAKYLFMVAIIAIILLVEVIIETLLEKSRSMLLKMIIIFLVLLVTFFLIINIPTYLFYNISLLDIIGPYASMYVVFMITIIVIITVAAVISNRKYAANALNKVLQNSNKNDRF